MGSPDPTLLNTVFVLIGLADEYFEFSRPSPEKGGLQSFYPHERSIADFYERTLWRLREETQVAATIERIIEHGGHVSFRSRELAAVLAAAYGSNTGIADEMFPKYMTEDSGPHIAERASFLLGAYIRYGEGDGFRLANSANKALVLTHILPVFRCRSLTWKQYFAIPHHNHITFETSPWLKDWLGQGMPW